MAEFLVGAFLVWFFVDYVTRLIDEGRSWEQWHWLKTPRKEG